MFSDNSSLRKRNIYSKQEIKVSRVEPDLNKLKNRTISPQIRVSRIVQPQTGVNKRLAALISQERDKSREEEVYQYKKASKNKPHILNFQE